MTNTQTMRVSQFARKNNVLSKHVIYVLNLTGNPVKSASSRLEIREGNRIYFESVAAFSRELQARG